jgi:preprotein translocase subunit SecA
MIKQFSFEKKLWKKYTPLITSINQIEADLQVLSDVELKDKTKKLKASSLNQKLNLETKTLVESFALVREASRRTLGLRHYDTQLLGGLILNDNKIAEMRTGEGKTLVATAPAYANALCGKGVHLVTVNEYLAQRDAEWMGQIYRYLGLKVGLVQSQMLSTQRRKNYNRDITYITNSEVGFDFLRDNLVTNIKSLVQRPFHFCIVDEVDSILIDEARTPLIISGRTSVEIEKIIKATEVAKFLVEFKDYQVDQKSKNISLTSFGLKKAQKLIKADNLYDSRDPWVSFLLNALKAKHLFLKDVHYIVKNKEIVIVDEFTGRIMEGRQWAEGLHSAIEAKESIYKMQGSETIASITYQNFFRLYPKIAGMTGTAKTEELEFENIYNLSVSILPTYKSIKRVDLPDAIYMDEITKWKAVAKECKKLHLLERPILVGTTTIQNSEILSSLLMDAQIPHKLLNAKPENIKMESEIIAQAGCLGSVTISTNMAGRGTDVLLGGNAEFKAYQHTIFILKSIVEKKSIQSFGNIENYLSLLRKDRSKLIDLQNDFESLLNVINMPNKSLNSFEDLVLKVYQRILKIYQEECEKEKEKVLSLGGLYVIGTERHESRRIDNQLRGRAGRQGDPGTSRFFLSLNDPLLKTFGGDKIKGIMQVFQMNDEALESKFLSQALDSAQQKVEGFYYDQRKTLNKYDRVLDKQRYILYKFRKKVLFSQTIRDLLLEFGEAIIEDLFQDLKKKNNKLLISDLIYYLVQVLDLSFETTKEIDLNEIAFLKAKLYEQFWSVYSVKELNAWIYDLNRRVRKKLFRKHEKQLVLKWIDFYWSKHLENMNFLKDAVTWEAYAQKDPFIKYEEQAETSFNKTFKQCRDVIIYQLLSKDINF